MGFGVARDQCVPKVTRNISKRARLVDVTMTSPILENVIGA